MNLSDKKVLVYDLGIFSSVATRLARDFGTVYYYVPWEEAFAKHDKALIGTNLDNLERIKEFEDYVDQADILVFPDQYSTSKVNYYRNNGYLVAGVGEGEKFEMDRIFARETQEKVGLPTQFTVVIEGVTELKDYLQDKENKYVKLSTFRGDLESFHHLDYESSLSTFNKLQYELGPKGDHVTFIVEDMIEGPEPGLDCILYDGKVQSPTMLGYEVRGAGYIASVMDYERIARPVKEITDKLAPVLHKLNYNFFFSVEMKVPDSKTAYLIDPCCRFAAPGTSALQTELIDNFSEVIYGMATGEYVKPTMKHKYGASLVLYSDCAKDDWLNISFPPEIAEWVKLRRGCYFDGEYWIVPGEATLCSVLALGESVEDVVKLACERAEKVKANGIRGGEEDMQKVVKAIDKGRMNGIQF